MGALRLVAAAALNNIGQSLFIFAKISFGSRFSPLTQAGWKRCPTLVPAMPAWGQTRPNQPAATKFTGTLRCLRGKPEKIFVWLQQG